MKLKKSLGITKYLLLILLFFRHLSGYDTPFEGSFGDSSDCKIGLVLSAGGALGLAHIGVLKVFEQNQIPVSFITGTSMGALIGGAYAAGYSAAQIESIALSIDWSKILKPTKPFGTLYLPEREKSKKFIIEMRHRHFIPILPTGIIPLQNLEFLLMELFAEPSFHAQYDFDSLILPYRAIAVDLHSGKKVAIKSGRLDRAVRASIAVPGIFASVKIDSLELIDGGVQQYLPVEEIFTFNPDFVIGVVTTKTTISSETSVIDVINRTMNILSNENLQKQKSYLNVLVEPELERFNPADFSKVKEIINAGEEAALKSLPEIKEKLKNKRLFFPKNYKRVKRDFPIVRSIKFKGLNTTKENILQRFIKVKPGDHLSFNYLINDLKSLYQTGLFDNINYELDFVQNDSVDIIILAHEPFYGIYRFGIRYDNMDGLATDFEIGQLNLFGTGGGISLALNLGNPNEIKIGVGGTRLFLIPFSYYFDGSWCVITHQLYRENKWITDYSTIYRGGTAEAGYSIGKYTFFTIGIESQQVIYHIPPIPWKDSIPEKEFMVCPFLNWELNNLDDFYLPTTGTKIALNIKYSNLRIKSDSNFLKTNILYEQYNKIKKKIILKYGIGLGFVGGGLPLVEYFYSGGEDFVGFDKDEFLSRERLILTSGIDLKIFELFNRGDYPVFMGMIFNTGIFGHNVFDRKEFLKSVEYGAGLGARANTPIGPVKLIFGLGNFVKGKENIRINTYISIGREFRNIF
ncbi:MAG: patatin-like phospholipase family protein [bacterium]